MLGKRVQRHNLPVQSLDYSVDPTLITGTLAQIQRSVHDGQLAERDPLHHIAVRFIATVQILLHPTKRMPLEQLEQPRKLFHPNPVVVNNQQYYV